jgi:hypothetical protein
MIRDRKPETRLQQAAADAEMKLGEAVQKYVLAAEADLNERGAPEDEGFHFAVRNMLSAVASQALTLVMTELRMRCSGISADDFASDAGQLFRLIANQAFGRIGSDESLRDHVALIDEKLHLTKYPNHS